MVSGIHPLFFWAPPPGTGLPPGPFLRRFSSPSQSSSGSSGRSVAFASMSLHYWKWFLEKKQGAGKCFVSWSQIFPTADLLRLPWTNTSAPSQGFSNWQFKSTTYSVVWVKYLSQKGKKNQAPVNRGRDDGMGQGNHWQVENIPKCKKGPLFGFVKNGPKWHVLLQTPFPSICSYASYPSKLWFSSICAFLYDRISNFKADRYGIYYSSLLWIYYSDC